MRKRLVCDFCSPAERQSMNRFAGHLHVVPRDSEQGAN